MSDLDMIRAVAAHHRDALIQRARLLHDDHRAVAGLAWGVHALEKVLRACDGETDPARLGLPEATLTVEPDGLFG